MVVSLQSSQLWNLFFLPDSRFLKNVFGHAAQLLPTHSPPFFFSVIFSLFFSQAIEEGLD